MCKRRTERYLLHEMWIRDHEFLNSQRRERLTARSVSRLSCDSWIKVLKIVFTIIFFLKIYYNCHDGIVVYHTSLTKILQS